MPSGANLRGRVHMFGLRGDTVAAHPSGCLRERARSMRSLVSCFSVSLEVAFQASLLRFTRQIIASAMLSAACSAPAELLLERTDYGRV